MQVVQTELDGVLLFEPTPHRDARGFFSRTSDNAVLAAAGIEPTFPQDSQSRSIRGVIRGMHGRFGAVTSPPVREGADSTALRWPGAGGADRAGRGAAVRADPAP